MKLIILSNMFESMRRIDGSIERNKTKKTPLIFEFNFWYFTFQVVPSWLFEHYSTFFLVQGYVSLFFDDDVKLALHYLFINLAETIYKVIPNIKIYHRYKNHGF